MKNSNFVFAFIFVLDICFFTYLTERRDWLTFLMDRGALVVGLLRQY